MFRKNYFKRYLVVINGKKRVTSMAKMQNGKQRLINAMFGFNGSKKAKDLMNEKFAIDRIIQNI